MVKYAAISENRSPNITAAPTGPIQLTVNQVGSYTIEFVDPDSGDTVSTRIAYSISDSNVTTLSATSVQVNVNPTSTSITQPVGLILTDNKGGSTTWTVTADLCSGCSNRGSCLFNQLRAGQLVDASVRLVECECDTGYTGNDCEQEVDGCANNPCPAVANCTDLTPAQEVAQNRSFICTCPSGYETLGSKCKDIDECLSDSSNTCNASISTCANTDGSFSCTCNTGYRNTDTQTCADINECTARTDGCEQICTNTIGSFTCSCQTGYNLNSDGKTCTLTDAAVCASSSCVSPASCYNSNGAAACFCPPGYNLLSDGVTCNDIDECSTDNQCSPTSACENTQGSYTCACAVGFRLEADMRTCTACDSLHWGAGCSNLCDCSARSTRCDSVIGCTDCVPGYEGQNCNNDIDECALNATLCGVNAQCSNTQGSYDCTCLAGYTKNSSGVCIDINECAAATDGCEQVCNNSPGSYTCGCNPGYTLTNSTHCTDVDECLLQTDNCDHVCSNTVGSFRCSCFNSDYQLALNGYTCKKVANASLQACIDAGLNCNQGLCNATASPPVCFCRSGYQLQGNETCIDIDECAQNLDDCNSNTSTCNNNDGSYTCSCNSGFLLEQSDQRTCNDINECDTTNNCASNAQCTNTFGSYTCACNQGYSGDGQSCTNVDECLTTPCHTNATCRDTIGSYTCTCNSGFSGNGQTCSDIDECTTTNDCSPNAYCTNTVGSYTCTCKSAFIGNGTDCKALQGIKVKMVFDEVYSPTKYQTGSADYQILLRTLEDFYRSYPGFYRIDITSIENGSVVVYYTVQLNTTAPENETETNLSLYILNGVQAANNRLVDPGTGTATFTLLRTPDLVIGSVTDIDECLRNNGDCDSNAACANTVGSYTCTCNSGYHGNGFRCDRDTTYRVNMTLDVVDPTPYQNPSSAERVILTKSLTGFYQAFPGFREVVVTNTWHGSLITEHNVRTNTTGANLTAHRQAMKEYILTKLKALSYVFSEENVYFPVLGTPTLDGVVLKPCEVFGCQNGGQCGTGNRGNCRCQVGFSGDLCETKVGLTQDEIAIVAASTVGGVALIVAICILIAVIVYKKKKAREEKLKRGSRWRNYLHDSYGPATGIFHPKYTPYWQHLGRGGLASTVSGSSSRGSSSGSSREDYLHRDRFKSMNIYDNNWRGDQSDPDIFGWDTLLTGSLDPEREFRISRPKLAGGRNTAQIRLRPESNA
ncbi:fibrillin-1 [Lingula anatina]|uniref:Fibrillin-1 n=1 Tax=Lingula anatina TaxID=7574 RepID=A0A2R2MKZ4_LINAN|nr:fibrillin-1 [Lingula anatina]|eukprot:XP_023930883.1 fibrillin-1 [Lingula anatina]